MKSPNHSSVASKRGGSALSWPLCRPNHIDTRHATLRAGKLLPTHFSGVLSCVGDGSRVLRPVRGSSHTAARQAIVTAGQSRESRSELRCAQRAGEVDRRDGVGNGKGCGAGEDDGPLARCPTGLGHWLVLGWKTPCGTSEGIVTEMKAKVAKSRTAAPPQTLTSRRKRVVGSGGGGRCCSGRKATSSRSIWGLGAASRLSELCAGCQLVGLECAIAGHGRCLVDLVITSGWSEVGTAVLAVCVYDLHGYNGGGSCATDYITPSHHCPCIYMAALDLFAPV